MTRPTTVQTPMLTGALSSAPVAHTDRNKLRPEDRTVHEWYRFVLSFPPHLVTDYLERFGIGPSHTVLDPFCGTGTTLVECKKRGVGSVGSESNPMAHFASAVKVDWTAAPAKLEDYAETVVSAVRETLAKQGLDERRGLPLFSAKGERPPLPLRSLPPDQAKLLLKDSISPLPLHKTLILLDAIDGYGRRRERQYGRLALANALVHRIGNLKFGPEVGVGRIKDDAPVTEAWADCIRSIVHDLRLHQERADVPARVIKADSRDADRLLAPQSVDAVITSPPYPNEKDYTRTTRLESVILGLIRDKQALRALKRSLVRSNTRGVYKSDTDDREIADHAAIDDIAATIEQRRIALGKTSGFRALVPARHPSLFRRHAAPSRLVAPGPSPGREAGLCGRRSGVVSARDDPHRPTAGRHCSIVGLRRHRHRPVSDPAFDGDRRASPGRSRPAGVAGEDQDVALSTLNCSRRPQPARSGWRTAILLH